MTAPTSATIAHLAHFNATIGGAWAIKIAQEMSTNPLYCDPVRGPFIASIEDMQEAGAKGRGERGTAVHNYSQGRLV